MDSKNYELVQRKVKSLTDDANPNNDKTEEASMRAASSDDEPILRGMGPKTRSDDSDADACLDAQTAALRTKNLPQDTSSLGTHLDALLSSLPTKWRNWCVRFVFTIIMISVFSFIIYMGPKYVIGLVFIIQFKCFHEIISIGLAVYRMYDFPWFRMLSWYFLFTSNYFFFGESLIEFWSILLKKDEFLHFLVSYHRLISFVLYCIGFVWFVLSLRKSYYIRQFSLFAWTHVTLLLIVSQSLLIIENVFEGLIWFLVPVSMVICCDIFSYVFGFFFGKTPLIKLSPKKTWEGFIGGGISTVIFGVALSCFLMRSPYFLCPVHEYMEDFSNCTIPISFQLREVEVGKPFAFFFRILKKDPIIQMYPFIGHSIILALFASILGPFGGFFASGFKRAFRIKDFGAIIPGHGGLMDRFDCQLLMGTFVNVYLHTFIKSPSREKVIHSILRLSNDDQIFIYNNLKEELIQSGLLPNA
ncbi:hypothetical protein AB6A40_003124 [Gnathostoma spinigerum]|uniref:Phosphatidate cytidylyltransferase n=1 Tax=Gnathostoma spinigerum TaxID=75299 RepID=A0ABD6E8L5_9BILA